MFHPCLKVNLAIGRSHMNNACSLLHGYEISGNHTISQVFARFLQLEFLVSMLCVGDKECLRPSPFYSVPVRIK